MKTLPVDDVLANIYFLTEDCNRFTAQDRAFDYIESCFHRKDYDKINQFILSMDTVRVDHCMLTVLIVLLSWYVTDPHTHKYIHYTENLDKLSHALRSKFTDDRMDRYDTIITEAKAKLND